MLYPSATSPMGSLPVARVRRASPPRDSMECTAPRAWMMPVNMLVNLDCRIVPGILAPPRPNRQRAGLALPLVMCAVGRYHSQPNQPFPGGTNPIGTVVELYEALASAPDERARARLIAEAFERLDERYPHLPDLVTQQDLRETELRLLKELELLRSEFKAELKRNRNILLMWLVPLMFAQVGAMAALVKLL